MTTPPAAEHLGPVIRVADLAAGGQRDVRAEPGPEALAMLRAELGLLGLRKVRLEGRMLPIGKRNWRLEAHLGATVVQPCVVTLAPVTTRVEEDFARNWVSDFRAPEGDEVEIPETVEDEPLGPEIDLGAVLAEALAFYLPLYPRAEGAEVEQAAFTEPGKEALTDEAARPFAGLAALRDRFGHDD